MMKKVAIATALFMVAVTTFVVVSSSATGQRRGLFRANLNGFNEVPSISTTGAGVFLASINPAGDRIFYQLSYSRLDSDAHAAHIHLGQPGVAGGIIAFLCGGGDKPACPQRGGTVTGEIDPADVTGPANQGIEAGSMGEAVRAMRRGFVYANVHSTRFPGGEIRGQVRPPRGSRR